MKIVTMFAAVLLLVAASAPAQDPPKPPSELSQLKYFAGSWTCNGNAPASSFGPAHKTETALSIKPELDGFWYAASFADKKTAENKQPVKGVGQLGFDATGKQYRMLWVDNFGGWANETSPGWQGDTMVWTGDQVVAGDKGTARDTYVKKGDGEWTHKFEFQTKGQWNLIVDETCKRAAAPKK